ncbi:hypothetical protein PYW08_011319 [Mythimna loreyi]|uniref:Uncharacterized protein n=1 Tax=Mythimna loreyi TaxID=667449 RepID=A0ACC2Q6M3_9NEOP|nr:hypothetical protein PYW08_011319 [Mythimna loreyi]
MKTNWVCPPCKGSKKVDTSVSEVLAPGTRTNNSVDSASSPNPPFTAQTTDSEILLNLTSEIKLLRGDVGDLKSHINYVSEHLTKCYSRLDEYDTRIKSLEKREEEIISLNNTIINLREQLNAHAQTTLKNELEISGINEIKNENPLHIVRVIAHKIGVPIDDQDLDYVTRVGPRRQQSKETTESSPRKIIVRFVRRHKREDFLKAAKTRRSINSTDLDIPGATRNVYINERLTPGNRQLFRETKHSAKEHGYKFCWCKNGAILIRKQEGNPSIHIRSAEDLERYLGPNIAASP